MTTQTEALTLALEALQDYVDEYGPWSDDSGAQYVLRVGKETLAQPEQEKERCVGCEACIDTACGRDECPKGWPKAAQPEQEPDYKAIGQQAYESGYSTGYMDCAVKMKAQPEQEPVAWWNGNSKFATPKAKDWDKRTGGTTAFGCDIPLYTTPPQRTWVGLTDEDDLDWEEGGSLRDLVKAIEAKLKEKNDGREWQDLTDDEMLMIYGQNHEGKKYNLGRMVQQALKEKNT